MEEQRALRAAKDGDLATLEQLLEAGVLGPGITDALGAGLVHHATRAGHLACVKFLVQEAKLPGNQQAHNGATPVHDAAATGSLAELCWLVRDAGCGLQDQDASGVSPLHLAARFGHPVLVQWLLQEGHAATLETLEGALPLHHAAVSGDLTCLKLLVAAHSSTVNRQTHSGTSPLYLACQAGHLHLAQFLVKDCRADVHVRALDGMSVLHAAAAHGHYSLVVWLVTFTDISLTVRDHEGATALHFAARGGHMPILERLLLLGAPVMRDSRGGSPLHDAAENGHMECCQTLISHHVDPSLRDEDGYTAADLAEYHGHQGCAQYLRETSQPGSELAAGDSDSLTTLHLDGPPSGDLDSVVPTQDEHGQPIPEWKRQVMVRKLQARLGADTAPEAQDGSGSMGPTEQAAWQYSQSPQAILGPFGELLTEDDLAHLEKQIADLQLRHRCLEYKSQMDELAVELQARLPAPLVSITVNSHFPPWALQLQDEEASTTAAEGVMPTGQPLPFWCSHVARLVRSVSLLLKGLDGLVRGQEKPAALPHQEPCRETLARPPRTTVQREIQRCGVSVQRLRGNFESAPGLSCNTNPGPGEAGAQPERCPRGCWPAPAQPHSGLIGGEPGPGNTKEASDPSFSCKGAPSEAGAPPCPPLAIFLLFLSHWKKSANTPALKTAACGTLEARGTRPLAQEAASSPRPPSLPPSEGPRLGHLWRQQSVITRLLGSWEAGAGHVPVRQLRRPSRRPQGLLSPEQFLPHVDGAPVPYSSLTLDLFMLGYFQLLECDLPPEERRTRHLLCFEVFEHLGAHGWEAVRAFHKAVTDEVATGHRAWTDGFEDIKARFFGSSHSPACVGNYL